MGRWGSRYQNWYSCRNTLVTMPLFSLLLLDTIGHLILSLALKATTVSHLKNCPSILGICPYPFISWVCSDWPLPAGICIFLPKSFLWIYKGCSICKWQAESTSELISLSPQAKTDENLCTHKLPLFSGWITLMFILYRLPKEIGSGHHTVVAGLIMPHHWLPLLPLFHLPSLLLVFLNFPNKLLALESLSQSLLLVEPNLR